MRSRFWLIALVLVLFGCAERREPCCPCPEEKVLDHELMVRLASARSLHHQANLHLQQGEVEQAIEAVRRILLLDLDSRWPEAEEARLDATARLAKLLLGQGKEQGALQSAENGIQTATRDSFYLSNLHSVRGEILEERSQRLEREGDKNGAKQVAREAIAAFERSIAINKRLQRELLEKGKR